MAKTRARIAIAVLSLALTALHSSAFTSTCGLVGCTQSGGVALQLPAKSRKWQTKPLMMSTTSTESEVDKPRTVRNDVQWSSQLLDAIFTFRPIFNIIKADAREKLVQRAAKVGCDWRGEVDLLAQTPAFDDLKQQYESVFNQGLDYPSYYTQPFHGYDEGNLCWLAAQEVEPAAVTVHSPIYAAKGEYEPSGDDELRSRFHSCMLEMLGSEFSPENVVDIGCSTGISTMKLHNTFPEANIVGVDLSPYFLAVARYRAATREAEMKASPKISYKHAAGEDTGLEDDSQDLVSLCLVNHELPTAAARDIFREAFRIVRPGGAIAVMDMNPMSEPFQKLARNPFAFAGFKSTEPHLQEYAAMDLSDEIASTGFQLSGQLLNSPRHQTVVGFKPAQ